jgi:putative membrane-bound dehydrogenase-like protein
MTSSFRHPTGSLIQLLSFILVAGLPGDGLAAVNSEKSAAYGKELPRVPPRSPAESIKAMTLQPGFGVELVAAEPRVHDPVAADFDARGRMYVVQLPPYNAYARTSPIPRGSIALLEDRTGDGHFEHSTVFAADLNYPSAVACWDGGIFVGDAPDLLFLKDTNGDGKADIRKVVLTGFGKDKAGESHLNSLRWGIDNRLHIWTSLSGGNVSAPANPEANPVSVRTRAILLDPRDWSRFELSSGGGQHGMSMDDWGRKFTCGNSQPALGVMYDDRYITRNPHLKAPKAAVDITPTGKHTKLFRISPPEPWRVLRTRLRKTGKFRGSDEGGTPFGFFTGATGITIYRGDAWPKSHWGNAIVGEVANNLVYRALVKPNGVGVTASRADAKAEFLASEDIWFRPVQFVSAPDGTLFILDMYRELIEGAAFLPPEFLDHIDPLSGNDRGRIYRLAPEGFTRRPSPNLNLASSAELAQLLKHRNGWHRDTAARLLYQRQDKSVVPVLREMVRDVALPVGRATALHSLNGLASLDEASILNALADPSTPVRIQALRLAERFAGKSSAISVQMTRLASDRELSVRYQAAFSLGALTTPTASDALAKLTLSDGTDSWMRMAILSSLGRNPAAVFQRLSPNKSFRQTTIGRDFLIALARQIGIDNRESQIGVVLKSLDSSITEKSLRQKLVQALVEKQRGPAREQILSASSSGAAGILTGIITAAKRRSVDLSLGIPQRVEAIHSLRLAEFTGVKTQLRDLLKPSQPPPVQIAALATAAEFNDSEVADLLLKSWTGLAPKIRARAAEALLSRSAWLTRFLDAVERGDVKTFEVEPARVQLLRQHPDQPTANRVAKLFVDRRASRQAVVAQYQPALSLKGDEQRGKNLFSEHCSTCHRLEGVGNEVGAELKGIRQRGLASVLLNILDPNREVKPEYLAYAVTTTDGRTLTGMIAAETANSITVRQIDATSITVQRTGIREVRSLGMSFMPEGLEFSIDTKAMADLLAYLNSIN